MSEASKGAFLGPFLSSQGGTLIRFGAALALVGGGSVAALQMNWILIVSIIMFVSIALAIAGVCMSLSDYPLQAVWVLVLLPPALWVWYMALPFVMRTTPAIGWASVVVGLFPLLLRGSPGPARA